MIEVNSAEAENHATRIGLASDQLTTNQTVTFSATTTVPGNNSAEETFEKLTHSATIIQQLLTRDVTQIQSAVSAFKRSDQKVKELFDASIQLKK